MLYIITELRCFRFILTSLRVRCRFLLVVACPRSNYFRWQALDLTNQVLSSTHKRTRRRNITKKAGEAHRVAHRHIDKERRTPSRGFRETRTAVAKSWDGCCDEGGVLHSCIVVVAYMSKYTPSHPYNAGPELGFPGLDKRRVHRGAKGREVIGDANEGLASSCSFSRYWYFPTRLLNCGRHPPSLKRLVVHVKYSVPRSSVRRAAYSFQH